MKLQNTTPLMPRLTAPKMSHGFQSQPASAMDRVDIHFGAKKNANVEAEIKNAQVATAEILGVPVQNGNVDLDNLRQTFYAKYYEFVADALIEGGDDIEKEGFYNLMPDMNLTQDDFCCNEGLLHYALPDDMLNSSDLSWPNVLGYADYKACEADMPRLLTGIAGKLGVTDSNPTDETIINAITTQSESGLKKFKKALAAKTFAKPESIPAPVVKVAFKKAIHTAFKPAVSATTLPPVHPFAGKTFVLTGTLSTMTRSEAEEKIKAVGGKITSSVSHKTDFVLAGEKAGNKLGLAQALKINVLDETAFLEKLK